MSHSLGLKGCLQLKWLFYSWFMLFKWCLIFKGFFLCFLDNIQGKGVYDTCNQSNIQVHCMIKITQMNIAY